MGVTKLLATVAAASLAVSPAFAAPVNGASVAASKSVRVGSASDKKNELAGGGIIVAVIAAAAVVAGIVIVAKDDDSPDSP